MADIPEGAYSDLRRITAWLVAVEWPSPEAYEEAVEVGLPPTPTCRYPDGTVVAYYRYREDLDLPITGPIRPSDHDVIWAGASR